MNFQEERETYYCSILSSIRNSCSHDKSSSSSSCFRKSCMTQQRMSELAKQIRIQAEWVSQGACRGMDPNLFFADRENVDVGTGKIVVDGGGGRSGDRAQYVSARAACAKCPVTEECLDYALSMNERDGFWGGTSPVARRVLRRNYLRRNRVSA